MMLLSLPTLSCYACVLVAFVTFEFLRGKRGNTTSRASLHLFQKLQAHERAKPPLYSALRAVPLYLPLLPIKKATWGGPRLCAPPASTCAPPASTGEVLPPPRSCPTLTVVRTVLPSPLIGCVSMSWRPSSNEKLPLLLPPPPPPARLPPTPPPLLTCL